MVKSAGEGRAEGREGLSHSEAVRVGLGGQMWRMGAHADWLPHTHPLQEPPPEGEPRLGARRAHSTDPSRSEEQMNSGEGAIQKESLVPRSTDKQRLNKQLHKWLLGARHGDSTPINIQQFRKSEISKGKKTINPSVGGGAIVFMKHSVLQHIGKVGEMNYILQLKRDVVDMPRSTKLVREGARNKPCSPETEFSFWTHCPEYLFSNSATQVACSTWSNTWLVFNYVIG